MATQRTPYVYGSAAPNIEVMPRRRMITREGDRQDPFPDQDQNGRQKLIKLLCY